jgi:hypothetical protein
MMHYTAVLIQLVRRSVVPASDSNRIVSNPLTVTAFNLAPHRANASSQSLRHVPKNSSKDHRQILLNLVLPDSYHGPSFAPEPPKVALITPAVDCNLLLPKWCELLAPDRKPIAVPKIAVYENDGACSSEDNIRPTGKVATVLSEPKAPPMKRAPHASLKIGVGVAHA